MTIVGTEYDQTRDLTSPEPYIEALPARALFADNRYQRDVDARRVVQMMTSFDRRLLGVLDVSKRSDGRYAILDGQHRHAAVMQTTPLAHLVCNVYEGLAVADEARLFHEINLKRKALNWWDTWKARRAAGDERVQAIEAVLTARSCRIHPSVAAGNIRATRAIETIVDELGDLDMLDSVLLIAIAAFGRSADAFDGAIMQGIALVLANYDPDELDAERLVRALVDVPPKQLRARAASLREAHRGTLPRLCAAVIVNRYNETRGRIIEPFFTRVPQMAKGDRKSTEHRNQRRHHAIRPLDEVIADLHREVDDATTASPDLDRLVTTVHPAESSRSGPPAHSSPTPPAGQVIPPVAPPGVAICRCGHAQRLHDHVDMYCNALGCECAEYTAAS